MGKNRMFLVSLLGVVLLMAMVAWMFAERPPQKFTILTGREGGAYYDAALAYKQVAASKGFDLELLPTAGSPEVIARLENGDAGIGFVQGGAGALGSPDDLSTMASIFFEPLWFFYRSDSWDGQPVTDYSQLAGKRLSVGELNSGTALLASMVLSETAVTSTTAQFANLSTSDALAALKEDEIDGAFVVVSPSSPRVAEFLSLPGVEVMSVEMAEGYAARHGYLRALTLYAGTLDPAREIPREDTKLISTVANLVVRNDFHPDLLRLMTIAAVRTHELGGILEDRFEFPNLQYAELPVREETLAYIADVKEGSSWLDKYLPFWLAAIIRSILPAAISNRPDCGSTCQSEPGSLRHDDPQPHLPLVRHRA